MHAMVLHCHAVTLQNLVGKTYKGRTEDFNSFYLFDMQQRPHYT